MWRVSSRSGVATLRIAIHLLLTYLLTLYTCYECTRVFYKQSKRQTYKYQLLQMDPRDALYQLLNNFATKCLENYHRPHLFYFFSRLADVLTSEIR